MFLNVITNCLEEKFIFLLENIIGKFYFRFRSRTSGFPIFTVWKYNQMQSTLNYQAETLYTTSFESFC